MTAWRTLKASVRGAAHVRAGLPNQDAVRLQDWLNETSQQGSGDDISVGIIWQPVGARPK